MNLTPYLVLAGIFVIGAILGIVGGVLRIFGAAFSLLALVLLIALFIFIPPDE